MGGLALLRCYYIESYRSVAYLLQPDRVPPALFPAEANQIGCPFVGPSAALRTSSKPCLTSPMTLLPHSKPHPLRPSRPVFYSMRVDAGILSNSAVIHLLLLLRPVTRSTDKPTNHIEWNSIPLKAVDYFFSSCLSGKVRPLNDRDFVVLGVILHVSGISNQDTSHPFDPCWP